MFRLDDFTKAPARSTRMRSAGRRNGGAPSAVRENAMRRGQWLSRGSAWRRVFVLGAVLLAAGAARAQSPVLPGQTLAFDRSKGNCLTCHDIKDGDSPGNVGPPLADMKKRFPDRTELAAIVF
jgi:hypothetical protein